MENFFENFAGETTNGYKLIQLLGQGAFGQVYKVENLITKEIFALKLVVKLSSSNPRKSPQNEYNLLKELDSPYLIRLIGEDFFAFNQYYCFLTEFCEVEKTIFVNF